MRKFWSVLVTFTVAGMISVTALAGVRDGYLEFLKFIEEMASREQVPATSGDYDYIVNGDKAVIVKYHGEAESAEVPAEIDGCPVVGIGQEAFSYADLKSVFIPDGIQGIGERAFEYCTISESLQLPENVTIAEGAFGYALLPDAVMIPAGAVAEDSAFSYCKGMETVAVEPGAELKSRAFSYCEDLDRVICGDGVVLEAAAFEYIDDLETAILCGEVKMNDDAFSYCDQVEVTLAEAEEYNTYKSENRFAAGGTVPSLEDIEGQSAARLVTGDFLYQALGNEKLANIMNEPPVRLLFHVDQGGYGRTAVFSEGEALDQAVALLCNIRIGEETQEWVTDNYNWISAVWADGSEAFISLNLDSLEYYTDSETYLYKLENLGDFWSYCESYLEDDVYEPGTETGSEHADNIWDEPVTQALELIREAWMAQAEQNPDIKSKP